MAVGSFLLCFLISAPLVNAESILVKTERTATGRMHYSFSNTDVNTDGYQDALDFAPMSARERAQADAISREDAANRKKDRDHYRNVNREMEQERAIKAYQEQMRQKELQEKKEKKKAIPVIVVN